MGKTSVVEGLARAADFHFSVSMTTRPPRPSERDGRDYRFVNRADFEAAIAAGQLLEWAEYGGNLYGTPRRPVMEHLDRGENVLLDIENDGARQVKSRFPEAVLVFLMPPSREELEKRLRTRGDTGDDAIRKRLDVASSQIADAEANFDYLVVNDDIETAVSEVTGILGA